jgi:hypothetical protein
LPIDFNGKIKKADYLFLSMLERDITAAVSGVYSPKAVVEMLSRGYSVSAALT